jgi:hypothetical protein
MRRWACRGLCLLAQMDPRPYALAVSRRKARGKIGEDRQTHGHAVRSCFDPCYSQRACDVSGISIPLHLNIRVSPKTVIPPQAGIQRCTDGTI